MARILILSSGSPCRNPRPLKEATALGAAGHDVALFTISESPALDELESALVRGRPFRHHAVGRNPSRAARLFRRLRRRAATQLTEAGWPSLHALGSAGPLRRAAFAHPADLTIVHNEIPHWIGRDLLAAGRRVAADFEDWHTEDLLPAHRRGRPLAPMRAIEHTLLHRAAYVTTTSHALSEGLARRYAAPPPTVLTNAFPLQPDPHLGPVGTPPAFFWFSQTIGPGRGLEEFCAAWSLTTHPSRLVLLGHPSPGFLPELLGHLPADFAGRVEILPLVPAGDLPGVIARHDIGLALEQTWIVNRDLTITNKILQYLNAGLAVVATATSGQREVLHQAPGAGILIEDLAPASCARALDALLAEPARIAAAGRAARLAAETTYCWERETPRLLALVEAALASPPPRP